MNILLLEPDMSIAQSVTNAFSDRGHLVRWATSSQMGIDLADSQVPDVVVLELAIPWHNGIEFIYEFRSYAEWFNIPIIVFSTLFTDKHHLLKKISIDEYLYKPVTTLQQLITTCNELVAHHAQHGATHLKES